MKKRSFFRAPIQQDPLPMPTANYSHYALIYWRSKNKRIEPQILEWWSDLNKVDSAFPFILIEVTNDPNPPMLPPLPFLTYSRKPLFFSISVKDIEEDPSARVAFMQFLEQLTLSTTPDYESIE
ncbi:hypothetical protein [Entomospira entomophila]|nr:hypothetical protein [Entomospira entomophilus]